MFGFKALITALPYSFSLAMSPLGLQVRRWNIRRTARNFLAKRHNFSILRHLAEPVIPEQ
jgi:hypothetical protein